MQETGNSKIIKKLEWGKYVSPLSDRKTAPFNWYAFKNRFGSELVSKIFSMFGVSKGQTIFDPFCGGGTTLIKAKLDGCNAVGIDISPFSVFLTNTLLKTYNPNELEKTLKYISHETNQKIEIPDVEILKKAFSDSTLKYIYSLRNSIESLNSSDKDFFLFSLLSILNSVSKAKKSGGFLRITNQNKASINIVKQMFIETCNKFINELKYVKYSKGYAKALLGDARDYPDSIKAKLYDAILTSPPYPNRHDYTRIYQLELLLGFVEDNQALKCLRYDTLRSHVEAKKKFDSNGYVVPSLMVKKVNELRKRKLNNSQIIPTLYGYFEDMYLCLKEMKKVLKPKKYIGLVISNVRFEGIIIPADEILCSIGEQIGLKNKGIYVLRYRGNSSQQMLKYKRSPNRESLIVFQK